MNTPARILVVDDEVKNVKLLEAMLAPQGFHIEKAYDGQEALEKVRSCRPDVVLLDVMMPVLDGFEVCRRLKNDPETQFLPIVIMTALGEVDHRIQGKEAGADDYLTKPVDRRELLARIQSLLRLNRAITQKISVLEEIQKRLANFVPPSVARKLAENAGRNDFLKKEEDASVLFVDITDYTRISESVPNEQVIAMVETLFSSFIDRVQAHGGEISNTAGDGMMVIFQAEDPVEHAVKAVQTALDFLKVTEQVEQGPALLALRDTRPEPLSVHIGIHSGLAWVGPTKLEGATATRWVYTAVGSVVNLAARISGFAKAGMVVVSEETARRVQGRFEFKDLGPQQFKNVALAVPVFQVLPNNNNHPRHTMKTPRPRPPQLLALILIAGACLSPSRAPASASGPDPGYTGAPGETTCIACHTPPVARAGSVSLSGVPPAYNPGVTYGLTVTVNDTGNKFGFQLTALTSSGAQAGTLTTTPTTQLTSSNILGNVRQYIEHNFTFASTATNAWKFNWTAPGDFVGPVNFYVSGLRANNTAGTDLDTIYNTLKTSLDHLRVAIARSGTNVVLSWTGGTLQYVDTLVGNGSETIWTNVPGNPASPYTTNTLPARRFYRTAFP